MATVYLAEDIEQGRKVALKVLRPELLAARDHERSLARSRPPPTLRHPNILPLYDSGEVRGCLFYVTPYAGGESLRDRLTRETQLPIADALRIGVASGPVSPGQPMPT